MSAASPVKATPRTFTRVARFRVGDYGLAVDATLIEQVIDEALEVSPLPLAPVHVPGAVRVRDVGIPLLDIAALFGRPRERSAGASALTMIVTHPRGRFAVSVDELRGLSPVRDEYFCEIDIQHPTAEGVFSTLYQAPGERTSDVLLDVEAIARVGDLHAVLAAPSVSGHRRVDLGSTYFVVEVADRKLAFSAAQVRHVQANTLIDPVTFTHRALLGFYQLGAERVAVVDMAVVLGIREVSEMSRTRSLVVIEDERGAPIAFSVSAILDMERFAEDTIRSLADDDGRDHPVWRGTYQSGTHGAVLVADCGAVWSMGQMVDSRALFGHGHTSETGPQPNGEVVAHMIYRVAGGLLASRVYDARAVIALPADFVDLRETGDAVVGLFTHKHRTVQVMDLAALMGRPRLEHPAHKPVLVLNTERGLLGLLVDHVVCMRSATPSRIPGASRRPYGIIPAFSEMVQVEVDGAERGVTVLDLGALADHGDLMQAMGRLAH